ncbi:hypothetical protein ACF1BQ_002130 [Bradyrhizobium sp. RDT10]
MVHQLAFPIAKVIKDNLSLVMMFAYSQPPLREFRRSQFTGGWPHVDEVLFAIPEQVAIRAFLELALLFRTLDDQENIDDGSLGASFGTLFLKGTTTPLHMRDVANKIIHAQRHEWIFTDAQQPTLRAIADPTAKEKWTHADIDIKTFAVGCGMLMS